MAPYYRSVTAASALPLDQALLDSMEATNKAELEKLHQRLEEAEKTEGESDIADALQAQANHFTRIGDKVRVLDFQLPGHANLMRLIWRRRRLSKGRKRHWRRRRGSARE